MPIVVRPVEIGDLESVAELMTEMDKFYDELDRESIETKVANMRELLFGTPPSAYMLVASDGNGPTPLGFAAYSFLWPAVGTTRSLYLKELYVRLDRRRDGLGRSLMSSLFTLARDSRCSRVEWTTDRTNVAAQSFYNSLDAKPTTDKIFFRVACS